MEPRSHVSRPLFWILRPIHRLFMAIYFQVRIEHAERLEGAGSFILAPIHRSKWDSIVLTHLTGMPLRYLASRREFKGLQGWIMRRMGAFPVNTKAPAPGPIRHARDLVVAGRPLVIFPEGTIFYYRRGEIHPLKRGAAWLALGASERLDGRPVRIIPIRLNYSDRFPRFRSEIEIVVEPPIMVSPCLSLPRKEFLQKITSRLQASLGERVNVSMDERYPAESLRRKARRGPAIADKEPDRTRLSMKRALERFSFGSHTEFLVPMLRLEHYPQLFETAIPVFTFTMDSVHLIHDSLQ